MTVVIVIPARYSSKRFPGKPLAPIAGKSLLERTWQVACAVDGVEAVYVATDDSRVSDHAKAFGADVLMTSESCENGTERVFEAVGQCSKRPEIIINLQGDAPLSPPWTIQALVEAMRQDPSAGLATLATPLSHDDYLILQARKQAGDMGGTLVTFDCQHSALYFSRSMIPFLREPNKAQNNNGSPAAWRHVGIYGYRYETLAKYLTLKPSPLEMAEKLEQLRALENGIKITVVPVDYKGRTHWSVDSPADVTMVEEIIAREGELV